MAEESRSRVLIHLEACLSATSLPAIRYVPRGENALLLTILLGHLASPSTLVGSLHPVVPSLLVLWFLFPLLPLLALVAPLRQSAVRAIPVAASRCLRAPPAGPGRAARCRPFQHLGDLERVMVLREMQTAHSMT